MLAVSRPKYFRGWTNAAVLLKCMAAPAVYSKGIQNHRPIESDAMHPLNHHVTIHNPLHVWHSSGESTPNHPTECTFCQANDPPRRLAATEWAWNNMVIWLMMVASCLKLNSNTPSSKMTLLLLLLLLLVDPVVWIISKVRVWAVVLVVGWRLLHFEMLISFCDKHVNLRQCDTFLIMH